MAKHQDEASSYRRAYEPQEDSEINEDIADQIIEAEQIGEDIQSEEVLITEE